MDHKIEVKQRLDYHKKVENQEWVLWVYRVVDSNRHTKLLELNLEELDEFVAELIKYRKDLLEKKETVFTESNGKPWRDKCEMNNRRKQKE